ncbi:30S ribosomal protein S6--L-glutamate ligase [filamentous cyanobacterium LEGE 11480]|uniref:Probable alpha-L-glutamate ligase n=1 Tax=Romeriopsis navalis LEGE 11480 TaxID=2777977 RepID=A0A928Z382_9CYAN|nr:30S ribosomal protein S6--L-glutamate ligase [Romeriopsis navalis]MBE9029060.1 30S ribosomal protein S6--L-glutamate ligase [Romeriopsis navalis LEGE 11480]
MTNAGSAQESSKKLIIGCEEWVELPDLQLPLIKARIDSGAKTSSLHAYNIQAFELDGQTHVRFDIHPIQKNRRIAQHCQAKVIDQRAVKSSNGVSENRFVILTPIILGEQRWEIEVTLTNRDAMGYRMLLGREAMSDRILVDPSVSFLHREADDEIAKRSYTPPTKAKSALRIVLLASNATLYSNRRIIEAGEARGHEMIFVNVRECYMNVSHSKPEIHLRGGNVLSNIDAVIPRLRPAITFYGCAVTRQFHSMGVYCLNDATAITQSRDKLLSLQLLSAKGISMPVTGFANSPQDTKDLIKMVGGAPLIVKLLEGTQGVGVVLAETTKAAESVINAFKSLKADILVQEYIKEAKGVDLRCFVIDGKVVGTMLRRAADPDEFRANVHLGGQVSLVKLTPDEKKTAIAAAKAMGLQVAGVDILQSSTGPKVLEVNSSPGLEGIEAATGKDIAALMIEAIEKKVQAKSQ